MKMEQIFEWPEVSLSSARHHLAGYANTLERHERGEIVPPLDADRVTYYRQAIAELNYLVNGKIAIAEANCECPECVDDQEEREDLDFAFEEQRSSIGPTVVDEGEPKVPVFADSDVFHAGELIAREGDDLTQAKARFVADLAWAERRTDRSDAAMMGWTPFIIDTRAKLHIIETAIREQS